VADYSFCTHGQCRRTRGVMTVSDSLWDVVRVRHSE
jgi:hypothetical protein